LAPLPLPAVGLGWAVELLMVKLLRTVAVLPVVSLTRRPT